MLGAQNSAMTWYSLLSSHHAKVFYILFIAVSELHILCNVLEEHRWRWRWRWWRKTVNQQQVVMLRFGPSSTENIRIRRHFHFSNSIRWWFASAALPPLSISSLLLLFVNFGYRRIFWLVFWFCFKVRIPTKPANSCLLFLLRIQFLHNSAVVIMLAWSEALVTTDSWHFEKKKKTRNKNNNYIGNYAIC